MFGLVENHGYVDGNKRVAFMTAYVFLGVNGYDVDADEAEVAITIERAAAGEISEVALADWLRAREPLRLESHRFLRGGPSRAVQPSSQPDCLIDG